MDTDPTPIEFSVGIGYNKTFRVGLKSRSGDSGVVFPGEGRRERLEAPRYLRESGPGTGQFGHGMRRRGRLAAYWDSDSPLRKPDEKPVGSLFDNRATG